MDKHYQQFEEIYDAYAKAIFRFIYFRVSQYDIAEDIVQDTFLRFWKILSMGEGVRDTRALLYTIAHGLIVDHYRRQKYRVQIPLDIEKIDSELALATDDAENDAMAREEIEAVLAKLSVIKREYRDALLMRYVEDLSVSEIAEMIGKSENSMRVLIHRALKALKSKL
ncbi:MAG: RNA polymerase sigma factor [Patescibacteria group bacterium]|nr:RNA polymerase sigma factor [Patescibacteria group bacterium]